MKADALLDHEEAFGLCHHPFDLCGVVLWSITRTLRSDRAVIDPNLIAYFAPQQLINRHACGLARNIPQRMFDSAYRRTVGLKRSALPNF